MRTEKQSPAPAPETDALWQAARQFQEATPPPALRERLWDAIEASEGKTAPLGIRPPFRVSRGMVGGFAFAAAAIVGIGLYLLPGADVTPGVAFARAESALTTIRYATWETTWHVHFVKKGVFPDSTTHYTHWYQASPARLAFTITSSNFKGTDINVTDGRNAFHSVPEQHFFGTYEFDPDGRLPNAPDNSPEALLRREVLFPRNPNQPAGTEPPVVIEKTPTRYSPWKLERSAVNGKPAICFARRATLPGGHSNAAAESRVWLDPSTFRILRREDSYHDGEQETQFINENYRYDIAPPPGTFTIPTPAPSSWYEYADVKEFFEGPKDTYRLTATDETKIRALTEQAVAAMNRRDLKAFLALWSFDCIKFSRADSAGRPPEQAVADIKRNWEGRITLPPRLRGHFERTFRTQQINIEQATPSQVYFRADANDPYPPKYGSNRFSVRVTGAIHEVLDGKAHTSPPVDRLFVVQRVGKTFRIVNCTEYRTRGRND